MADIITERFLERKEKVVFEDKAPKGGNKPYQIVQEFDLWEVVTTEGKTLQERKKRQFMRTIKTETYNKEVEIEKRDEERLNKSKKKSSKIESPKGE